MAGGTVQHGGHERLHRPHAALEREVAVDLGQHGRPPPKADVVRQEARLGAEAVPAGAVAHGLAPDARQVAVMPCEEAARGERVGDGGQEALAQEGVGGARRGRVERRRVRDVVGVRRAVRRVEVEHEVGVVGAHEPDERAALGRVELHEVAVEVEPLRVRPLPHPLDGPVLVGPVTRVDPLVAVGVVDGRDEEREVVGPAGVLALRECAEERERGFFARHLARVDVRHDEHARLPGAPHGLRRRPRRADDGQRQRPPLGRLPERGQVDALRRRPDRIHERPHVGVRRGLTEARALGARLERVERGLGGREGREEGEDEREAAEHGHGVGDAGKIAPRRDVIVCSRERVVAHRSF